MGTAKIDEADISILIQKHFDLTPKGIIESLGLLAPIYATTAYHGHFGRKPGESGKGTFSWECTDKADAMRCNCDCKATAE
jgi:S-adenosylmethionine synthetase